jgi:hypothetical protein
MKLTNLVVGKQKAPRRIVLAGVEGIGKSTFAAAAPKPIFLGIEDGTAQLDVSRFPSPETFQDVLDAVAELISTEHDFRTLVVDTIDWLEPLIWQHCCRRDSKANIEAYGFGKGFQVAQVEWQRLLKGIEQLRREKRMEVIFLAHTHQKTFKNPSGEDFDRYEMKLNTKAAGLVKEWCDILLFAAYETFAVKAEQALKAKGFSTGARYIYTERTAAYDAKNRHSLPPQLPLDWQAFDDACREQQVAPPEVLEARVRELAEQLTFVSALKVHASLEKATGDAQKLAQLVSWTQAKVAAEAAGKQVTL